MYVCICNAVTEREVCEARDRGARTLDDLKTELQVATGCGQCEQVACQLLKGADDAVAPASAAELNGIPVHVAIDGGRCG